MGIPLHREYNVGHRSVSAVGSTRGGSRRWQTCQQSSHQAGLTQHGSDLIYTG